MDRADLEFLKAKADYIRQDVINISVKNGAGHLAPSLSTVDLLTYLYYNYLNIADKKDKFVLSKAHGCYALYSILCDLGFIPKEQWENFYIDSSLSGCVERNDDFGLLASAGSLGHGLPIAVGIAFGNLLQGISRVKSKVVCMVGDGEMQEGSMWESLQFIKAHYLDNLVIIVDCNKLQALDKTEDVLFTSKELENRIQSFGFHVTSCYGHNFYSIDNAFRNMEKVGLNVIFANTVKGNGLKFMENVTKFHYRVPTEKEMDNG